LAGPARLPGDHGRPVAASSGIVAVTERDRKPMLIIGRFILALAKILDIALSIYMWIIIARAVLSWVSPDPYNPIVRFIHNATEPVMQQVRRRLPLAFGGIDFTPIVVLLAIIFLQTFLVGSMMDLARGLLVP
jgi:YggT family protein